MLDIIRDSTLGNIINYLSDGRLLPFEDQKPGFICPPQYFSTHSPADPTSSSASTIASPSDGQKSRSMSVCSKETLVTPPTGKLEKDVGAGQQRKAPSSSSVGDPLTKDKDVEKDELREMIKVPDQYLVDWYGPEDPENPRNWSRGKRCFVLGLIMLLTFSVYVGSAIYTSGIPSIMEEFHVGQVLATLGLTLFVAGYGIGPLFLAPLQEIPILGRNPGYIASLAIFVILQVPTALVNNVAGLMVLRFLTGFFGSPALATGGASVSDIFDARYHPYVIGLWCIGAVCGPVLGPVLGGFAAQANGWRWPMWELLWASGFALVVLTILLPETLGDTILLRRARRLRKLTGNRKLRSKSEIDQEMLTKGEVIYDALVVPFKLMAEPSVFVINLYIALVYAFFYLFFESFPLVFTDIYHFNLGLSTLPFLGLIVAAFITFGGYCLYNYYHMSPRLDRADLIGNKLAPEVKLELALMTSLLVPVSLLLFGWTSRESVHWIVPTISSALYLPGVFLVFQSALNYLPLSYPRHAASVYASNDFFRSVFASVFPLFGKDLFVGLGLGPGCSLLAGLTALMIPCLYLIMKNGHRLRARSKYAE